MMLNKIAISRRLAKAMLAEAKKGVSQFESNQVIINKLRALRNMHDLPNTVDFELVQEIRKQQKPFRPSKVEMWPQYADPRSYDAVSEQLQRQKRFLSGITGLEFFKGMK